MRHVAMLLGGLLVVACAASAQESFSVHEVLASPSSIAAAGRNEIASDTSDGFALTPPASASLPLPDALPQGRYGVGGVQSIVPNYNFQLYGGYTFVRVFVLPGTSVSRNGFDMSLSYYFKGGYFGMEGALTTTFGNISGQNSNFLFAAGGPRVRWAAPRGLDLWAHGLGGWSHFGPQTPFGSREAPGYEVGGGVDINAHRQRLAYRLEADMISTRFFGTSQYSPKFSAGVVFKF